MPTIANPVHGLSLGDLVFVEDGESVVYVDAASGETYSFDVLDPDTQWGNPEPVTTTLLTLLSNGSQVTHVRDDNREPSIALTIRASGADALAAAEVALVKACGRPAELRWKPPSWASAVTVFDVVWSQLTHQMDGFDELSLRRTYKIELQALPDGRSANKTITPVVTATSPTVLDNCSSTTHWTVPFPTGAALSVVSGAIHVAYDPSLPDWNVYWCTAVARRTATIDTSVNKFIAVDWKSSRDVSYWLGTPPQSGGNYPGGEPRHLPEVRREPAPASGYTRSWYQVGDVTSLPWIQFAVFHPVDASSGTATFDIDQVLTANALPAVGTTRQKTATILPGGSVPAEGTIQVASATDGLGQTIVFSHPIADGYSPPLRRWLHTSPSVTPYTDSYSGAFHSLSTGPTLYALPASAVPDGDVHLWARLAKGLSVGAATVVWSVQAGLKDGTDVGSPQAGSMTYTFAAIDTWTLVPIARLSLPVNGAARFSITMQVGGGASVSIDEAWLFAMDKGRLTVVDCGTGSGGCNRLKISAPSLAEPFGAVMIATGDDFSDGYTPDATQVLCDQTGHRFDPDGSMIFTANEVASADVSLEHYRRVHTHAVD